MKTTKLSERNLPKNIFGSDKIILQLIAVTKKITDCHFIYSVNCNKKSSTQNSELVEDSLGQKILNERDETSLENVKVQ